jgi:hypothetical protein
MMRNAPPCWNGRILASLFFGWAGRGSASLPRILSAQLDGIMKRVFGASKRSSSKGPPEFAAYSYYLAIDAEVSVLPLESHPPSGQ